MKTGKYILFISSAFLNIFFLYMFFWKTPNINRKPFWHPFELNSDLNLESLVKSGYKFADYEYGEVFYQKRIKDTLIKYGVNIDCNKYEGKFDYDMLTEEEREGEEIKVKSNLKETEISKTIEEEIKKNKYYPWKLSEIGNCYQGTYYRVYTVNFGEKLNLKNIRSFIHNKGGRIINENLVREKGGNITIFYENNSLYFNVRVFKNNRAWYFGIADRIPHLDQKKEQKTIEQMKKRDKYYSFE